jgi:hypothetical protein
VELGIIREHHETKLLHLVRRIICDSIASSVELNVVKATTGPKFLLGIHAYHLFLSTLLVEYSILQQGLLHDYQLHHQLIQLHFFFTNIDIVKDFIALCFRNLRIIVSGSSGFPALTNFRRACILSMKDQRYLHVLKYVMELYKFLLDLVANRRVLGCGFAKGCRLEGCG